MVLSLLYGSNSPGKKYAQSSITGRTLGTIAFDTMVQEEHRYSSRVTYFPVENGSIISDHIINQPDIVVLSGLISDTPINIFAPFNRSIAAFNTLVSLHERREIVNVVTGIKIYPNMAIVSLDIPRTMKTGQTLTFNIELQRIIFDDDFNVLYSRGNVFEGVLDNTPRGIVRENAGIPLIQNDPAYSLKDQAESLVNVGLQGLNAVPPAILPNVLATVASIAGVV